mgnify:CR=1 FL=1
MKFHVRMLDYDAEERWKAILVHPNERVRDVVLKVADAISGYRDIHLDSRGIPECDLATVGAGVRIIAVTIIAVFNAPS